MEDWLQSKFFLKLSITCNLQNLRLDRLNYPTEEVQRQQQFPSRLCISLWSWRARQWVACSVAHSTDEKCKFEVKQMVRQLVEPKPKIKNIYYYYFVCNDFFANMINLLIYQSYDTLPKTLTGIM